MPHSVQPATHRVASSHAAPARPTRAAFTSSVAPLGTVPKNSVINPFAGNFSPRGGAATRQRQGAMGLNARNLGLNPERVLSAPSSNTTSTDDQPIDIAPQKPWLREPITSRQLGTLVTELNTLHAEFDDAWQRKYATLPAASLMRARLEGRIDVIPEWVKWLTENSRALEQLNGAIRHPGTTDFEARLCLLYLRGYSKIAELLLGDGFLLSPPGESSGFW